MLEEHGDTAAVLAMGNFNDEVFDGSLVQYALSTRQREKVLRSPTPRLWNLSWSQLGSTEGTFYFSGEASLFDQFLVNRNVIRDDSTFITDVGSFEILRFPIGMRLTEED